MPKTRTKYRGPKLTGRGGWRPGAGRPRGRTTISRNPRPEFAPGTPQLVTLRVKPDVPNLRRLRALEVVTAAIDAISIAYTANEYRIVHFVLLPDRLRLIAEADDAAALSRGTQSLAVRMARRLNIAIGRTGRMFADRYESRSLATPREVRNGLTQVLCAGRQLAPDKLDARWVDPYSTALWFDGWLEPVEIRDPRVRRLARAAMPTTEPSFPLLTTGWKRLGLLGFDEVPPPLPLAWM